jgi:tetratricopeptide (TPR) repeat protein
MSAGCLCLIILAVLTSTVLPLSSYGQDKGSPKTGAARIIELDEDDILTIPPRELVGICTKEIKASRNEANDRLARLYEKRGDAYMAMEDYASAVADFAECCKAAPDEPRLKYKHAMAIYLSSDPQADKAFEELVKRWPAFAPGYVGTGAIALRERDYQTCRKAWTKAIELDKQYAVAYYNRGVLSADEYKWTLALADVDKAIDLQPFSSRDLAGRGSRYAMRAYILTCLDRPDKGLKNALLAKRLAPRSPLVDWAMWEAYFHLGKHHLAENIADEMIRSHSKAYESFMALSKSLLVFGHTKEALAAAEKALKMDPRNPRLLCGLGHVYLEQGEYDLAQKAYKEASEAFPRDYPPAVAAQAYLLAACPDGKLRNGTMARSLAQKASDSLENKHPRYVMVRALAEAEGANYREAVRLAKLSISLCRSNYDYRSQYDSLLMLFERRQAYRFKRASDGIDYFKN